MLVLHKPDYPDEPEWAEPVLLAYEGEQLDLFVASQDALLGVDRVRRGSHLGTRRSHSVSVFGVSYVGLETKVFPLEPPDLGRHGGPSNTVSLSLMTINLP